MTAGIPDEMRRTALVSLAAHVVVLALLSVVPFVKVPLMEASSIQVMLVSKVTAPAPPPQVAILPELKPAETVSAPPAPKPVERAVPVTAPAPPKPIAPVQKALPAEPPAKREAPPPPVVKPEPVVPKQDALRDLNETLRRAEEALMKSSNTTASKPAVPPAAVPSKPRASEEINKLLGQLPSASPAPVVARAPQSAPRTAALERCPPKAQAYCPLLEAAINRVWNADTDPGVRSVLESAGDSTATIRMVILPDGVIREVQLSKSSGNDAYDRAVQSVLRELRHLPPLPAEMKGEPFVAVTNFTYNRKRDL